MNDVKSFRKSFFAIAPWVIIAICGYMHYQSHQRQKDWEEVKKQRAIEKEAVTELQRRSKFIFVNYTRRPQWRVKSVMCPVFGEHINGEWVINEPGLTDEDLKHLAVLTELQELEIFGCTFSNTGLEHLQGLTNLANLSITRNHQITDEGLVFLESLTSLKTLNLTGTSVTEKGVQELQKALPDCTITFKSIGR